ncbi:MAG TPA: 2-dehydropantoate 2-reductase [Alphaproteobacteria bacterium]|nr:2-dehydropantoate 2-reductase [Alphaproteobacteria bacterium]
MRIAVMAAGAVGGYFGARLAAAGEEVHVLARGAHLEAIRAEGLRIESPRGDLVIRPAQATDDPAAIGPVDIVLFAVKLWDTEAAGALCKPLLGRDTAVVSLLNGVDSEERLAAILGREHVMGGVAYIASTIAAPGLIRHTGTMARLVFGELDGTRSRRGAALLVACERAGIDSQLTDAIATELWRKFVLLAAFSGVTALTRQAAGAIRAEPWARRLFLDAVAEVAAVGRARGIALDTAMVAEIGATLDRLPAEMRASMAVDLERGNRLELDWLSGAVVRLGEAAGVPTPVHRVIAAALSFYAQGR